MVIGTWGSAIERRSQLLGPPLNTFVAELIEQAARALPVVVANRVLTQFEPEREEFLVRRGHVGPVTRLLRRGGHDEVVRFSTPKALDDVLCAAYRHLRDLERHEELVVLLGQKIGANAAGPTMFTGFWRGIGDRSSVNFSPLARDIIERHVTTVDGGCVAVVHNHPPHDLKSLLSLLMEWTPLPSSSDRETALSHDMRALARWFNTGHDGSYRWYLVDEGRMIEFFLPSVERFQRTFEYIHAQRAATGSFDMLQAARILLLP